MAINQEQLNYRDLIDVLGQLVRERRTGTMFIVTDTKHSARIGLERGRILSCTYTLFRGLDAVAHIRRIRSGKFTFSDGIFNSNAETPLPSTSDLLREFGATVEPDGISIEPSAKPVAERSVAAWDVGASTDMAVSGKALWKVVVSELAIHLGPVASFAAARYEEDLCSATCSERVQAILSKLALEIGEPSRAQEFKERVMAKISA